MAKDKSKNQKGVTQKHLHSRISYLYQAANYLASVENGVQQIPVLQNGASNKSSIGNIDAHTDSRDTPRQYSAPWNSKIRESEARITHNSCILPMSCRLVGSLRAISLKSQIRLTPELKQSICKRCDNILVTGSTSVARIENKSKGGRKPHADVLVLTCAICGAEKRFPVGATRQVRKHKRVHAGGQAPPLKEA